MRFFQFLKKKKEKKKLKEVVERYESDVLLEEQLKDSSAVKRYMMEQCDEISVAVTDFVSAKQEYDELTHYLTDIQILENMEEQDWNKLTDMASNILTLSQAKDFMSEKIKKLPDSQYAMMDSEKNDLPKTIIRFHDNEKNRDILKKDMDYLEGEKVEWTYEKTEVSNQQKILKKVSIGLLISCAFLLAAFLTMLLSEYRMAASILLGALAFFATVECFCLIRYQNNKLYLRQCLVNYNNAVTIQNSIKLKYINVANAVDYTCGKYQVKTARELEKRWQLYLEAAREKERLLQADDDLSYFKTSMLRLLRQYQLYDASIWPQQAIAITNPKEMVEVKHSLLERRQKIRNRMEQLANTIRELKIRVESLGKNNDLFTPEMKSVMESIDKLLG